MAAIFGKYSTSAGEVLVPISVDSSGRIEVVSPSGVEDAAIGTDGAVLMLEAKTSQKAAVDDGDAVIPVTNDNGELVLSGYDWSGNLIRVAEQDPLSAHHQESKLVDETNISTDTTDQAYFDMDSYRHFSLDGNMTIATDSITVKVYMSNQDDGTAPGSITVWHDVTNALFGVASWVNTDFFAICDTPVACKYVKVEWTTSDDSGDDSDLVVHVKKMH